MTSNTNNNRKKLIESLNNLTANKVERALINGRNTINSLPVPTVQPKLIIKYGPPASGKGSQAVRGIIESFGQPIGGYLQAGIDDLVEYTSYFKNKSREVAKKVLSNNVTSNALNKLSMNNAKKIGKVYQNVRFGENSSIHRKKLGEKLDDALAKAINQGKNITFETTGGKLDTKNFGLPIWLIEMATKKMASKKYKIVVIFPTVPFDTTWERYKSRAVRSYEKNKPVRFASTKKQLQNQYDASYLNFYNGLDKPAFTENVHEVFVIKPTGEPLKIKPNNNKPNNNKPNNNKPNNNKPKPGSSVGEIREYLRPLLYRGKAAV